MLGSSHLIYVEWDRTTFLPTNISDTLLSQICLTHSGSLKSMRGGAMVFNTDGKNNPSTPHSYTQTVEK